MKEVERAKEVALSVMLLDQEREKLKVRETELERRENELQSLLQKLD